MSLVHAPQRIDRITDMGRTVKNAIGNSVASCIVAKQEVSSIMPGWRCFPTDRIDRLLMPGDVVAPAGFCGGGDAPDVFVLRLPSPQDDALCEHFAIDCSALRRAQAQRYLRPEDRLRCLAAGWLLNHAVRAVAGTGAMEEKNAHGRPLLRNLPHLHVSLSHSGAWVVCALHGAAVGIDVEIEAIAEEGMAKLFMSDRELYQYRALSEVEEKKRFFFSVWTMKEAYLKAVGTGLACPLNLVSLDIGEDTVLVEDTSETYCGIKRLWSCHTATLAGGEARLALCWLSATSNNLMTSGKEEQQ